MTTKNGRTDYTIAIIAVAFFLFLSVVAWAPATGVIGQQPCKPAVVNQQ